AFLPENEAPSNPNHPYMLRKIECPVLDAAIYLVGGQILYEYNHYNYNVTIFHVPHAQVQGEAPQEPRPARRIHSLLQSQHRRLRLHHPRHSGPASYHPHSCCCPGAHPLHLLGRQEGLRLHLHVPLPVRLPRRAAGVHHHP
ncbi:hypothetical protein ACJX0J_022100, partial [Zea mays]